MSDKNCPDCMIDEDAIGPGTRCASHEIEFLKSYLSAAQAKISALEAILEEKQINFLLSKCAIRDCENKPTEGLFINNMCAPCATTNFKSLEASLALAEEALEFVDKRCQLYGPHDQARELISKALSSIQAAKIGQSMNSKHEGL